MEVNDEESDIEIDICCTDDDETLPFGGVADNLKSNNDAEESITSCSTPISTEMDSRSNSPMPIINHATNRKRSLSEKYIPCDNSSNSNDDPIKPNDGNAIHENLCSNSNSKCEAIDFQTSKVTESKPINSNDKEVNEKCKAEPSESVDDESDEDSSSQFYFESDHLALKKNKDYQLLLKTLVVLEAQRNKAVADLETLSSMKEKALQDPVAFVDGLQKKTLPEFPKHQKIAKHPDIDFTHYLVAYSNLKFPKGGKINTRRRIKGNEQDGEKEMVEDLRSNASDRPTDVDHTSKIWDETKPSSVSQLWTNEEQERLEKLLQVYPPEEIETRRWAKIADALGNRTAIQVASRVQKYFIKLAKAGLPVPGRVPSLHNMKKAKANRMSYRNSTFFPSWRPQVYMNDDDDDNSSINSYSLQGGTDDTTDDMDIPLELQDSEEYQELMELKRVRREKAKDVQQTIHRGFMCDYCGMEPIMGKRWHCLDCGDQDSVDLCNNCYLSKPTGIANHTSEHRLIEITKDNTFRDDDYLKFEQISGEYNYLDSNFKPSGK